MPKWVKKEVVQWQDKCFYELRKWQRNWIFPYAYKLIRSMNAELKKTGCITISGRIDRKFFYEKFYGTRDQNERRI